MFCFVHLFIMNLKLFYSLEWAQRVPLWLSMWFNRLYKDTTKRHFWIVHVFILSALAWEQLKYDRVLISDVTFNRRSEIFLLRTVSTLLSWMCFEMQDYCYGRKLVKRAFALWKGSLLKLVFTFWCQYIWAFFSVLFGISSVGQIL